MYKDVNIGIAISNEDELFVPVIKDADKKDIKEISSETKKIAIKSIRGELSLDDVEKGTFTITDMSSFGVMSFQPMINKDQTAILGICSEYELSGHKYMNLIMAFDHRSVNGMQASMFLNELKKLLEECDI